jgi:hypothetical protein
LPTYQWNLDGSPIPGVTGPTLTLNDVLAGAAGTYTVTATNIAGTATSHSAKLTVILPPIITSQPQSQTVTQGRSATFTVAASGTGPLR